MTNQTRTSARPIYLNNFYTHHTHMNKEKWGLKENEKKKMNSFIFIQINAHIASINLFQIVLYRIHINIYK